MGEWSTDLKLFLVWAAFEIFHGFPLHVVGLLGVDLRLWSCVFVMLLTLGAKAAPQTRSARAMTNCSQSHDRLLSEAWQTPGKAMTDFSQTQRSFFLNLKNSKSRLKYANIFFDKNNNNLNWGRKLYAKVNFELVNPFKAEPLKSGLTIKLDSFIIP